MTAGHENGFQFIDAGFEDLFACPHAGAEVAIFVDMITAIPSAVVVVVFTAGANHVIAPILPARLYRRSRLLA